MRSFLPLLCFLPIHCAFEGTCRRKEPSPGSLVLSPGSTLVLTCSGHVTVDGVKVRNGSNSGRRDFSQGATQTALNNISKTQVWIKSEKRTDAANQGPSGTNRSLGHTASGGAHTVRPTSARSLLKADDTDAEEEEEEEEIEGGSRVTRGIKSRHQWKWTRRTGGKGDKDIAWTREDALFLSPVRLTDSGTYTCSYRGRDMSTFKVIVAEPPEKPTLFCYKRSHSSKIRCESSPQERGSLRPNCSLFLSRRLMEPRPTFCPYSSRTSRCWCTLDHIDDDRRVTHSAYLCVTNIAGSVTSNVLHFTPMAIIKPNPPSNVVVQQVEGQETRMTVTWELPTSWNSQGNFFKLIFELKYRPLVSSFHYEQVLQIKDHYSDTITDVMPGVDYLIQLRTRDEYDGVWSDWSEPVCARSWTAPTSTATMIPDYTDIEGSGSDDNMSDVPPTLATELTEVSTHILWIFGLLAFLTIILAAYIIRHRDRLLSKLQSLTFDTQCGDSPQPLPSAPPAPEGQALVTLDPQCSSEHPQGEEENEEQRLNESKETMHFSNTSYFFLQQ